MCFKNHNYLWNFHLVGSVVEELLWEENQFFDLKYSFCHPLDCAIQGAHITCPHPTSYTPGYDDQSL
jgi:hypothetical protein